MTTHMAKAFTLLSVVALALSAVQSQSVRTATSNIPFDLRAGKTNLPAGEYIVRLLDGASASSAQDKASAQRIIYAITDSGDLLWYRHDGRGDGSFKWADANARKIGNGWNFKQLFSGGDGVIYAVDPIVEGTVQVTGGSTPASGGNLWWYRHVGREDGSFKWEGPKKIGTGWGGFKQLFSGGDGVIYAVTDNGDLMWYRHDGRSDGSFRWANNGKKIGTGWGGFKQLFSGGDGVIYAITDSGDLLWYRHDGRGDGSFKWADANARKIGNGWNFKQLFSGGDGVIYAVTDDGNLLWYRHDGRGDGSFRWANNNASKIGSGWNFKQLFSSNATSGTGSLEVPRVEQLPQPPNGRCQNYANGAVEDFKQANKFPKCRVNTNARWNPNYQHHYNWCLTAPPAESRNEYKLRDKHLLSCGARHTF